MYSFEPKARAMRYFYYNPGPIADSILNEKPFEGVPEEEVDMVDPIWDSEPEDAPNPLAKFFTQKKEEEKEEQKDDDVPWKTNYLTDDSDSDLDVFVDPKSAQVAGGVQALFDPRKHAKAVDKNPAITKKEDLHVLNKALVPTNQKGAPFNKPDPGSKHLLQYLKDKYAPPLVEPIVHKNAPPPPVQRKKEEPRQDDRRQQPEEEHLPVFGPEPRPKKWKPKKQKKGYIDNMPIFGPDPAPKGWKPKKQPKDKPVKQQKQPVGKEEQLPVFGPEPKPKKWKPKKHKKGFIDDKPIFGPEPKPKNWKPKKQKQQKPAKQ